MLAIWNFPALAEGAPVEFRAYALDGKTGEGTLIELTEKGGASIGGKEALSIKDGELVELRRVGTPLPSPPSGWQLALPGGDRIALDRGSALKLKEDRLHFHPAFGDHPEWVMPLSDLAMFWRAPPEGSVHPERTRLELASANRSRDVLLLANGDTVEGILESWDESDADADARKITMDVNGKKSSVPASDVAAVVLTTDAGSARPVKKEHVRVVLADGSRISLTLATSDGSTLSGKTLFGADLRLPLDQLVSLTVQQQRVVYLSDLKPATVKDSPYLPGPGPAFRMDRNLEGDHLVLGGDCHDKGIAMRAGSSLTFALDGKYRRFQATVGLDGASSKLGSARVRIKIDGKPQDEKRLDKELTRKIRPIAIDLDVTGGKELTLVVEPGLSGPVQSHIDWANARLLR